MSEESAAIFRCPACGSKVTGQEKSCPACSMPFDESVIFKCPFCGIRANPRTAVCPACKAEFPGARRTAEESRITSAMSDIVKEIEALETNTASAEIRALEEMLAKAKQTIETPSSRIAGVCPVCKSGIIANETRCPVCSAHVATPEQLAAEKILDEIEQLAEKQSIEQPRVSAPEQSAGLRARAELARAKEPTSVPETDHQEKKRRRLRGLTNGIGTTNGLGVRPDGRVNGRVNGMHLVNGKGAVNGRSMVNGTGILNGLKPKGLRPRAGLGKIRGVATWQFLAVLAAVIVIIPSVIFIQGMGNKNPYAVDGEFGEWEDSTHFGILASASAPTINVVEWSVGVHSSTLYLYLRTESAILSESRPMSFSLFIDSDNSVSTGYAVGGIGADLMLEVMAWNGSVGQSSLSSYTEDQDRMDWNQWRYYGPATCEASGAEIEVGAGVPFAVQEAARLILTSQDEDGPGCASSPVVLGGSLLIVEQMPGPGVTASGTLPADSQAELMRLRFSCQGSGGSVEGIVPVLAGATSYDLVNPFSLAIGESRTLDILVDTYSMSPGDFVSACVTADGITSEFSEIEVLGDAICSYIDQPPPSISIDGAFADWDGRTSSDTDGIPVTRPSIDIQDVGGMSTAQDSFFYVGVRGELLSGTFVPKACVIPSGSGGGGIVVPARKTAEDFLRIYIDADRSNATGKTVTHGQWMLGAEYMIEITGLCSEVRSETVHRYSNNQWIAQQGSIEAAKDSSRMEIGISSSAIGNVTDIDFLVETTDWNGNSDRASIDSAGQGTRRWVVDSTSTSAWATSMSYQRKTFYDGTNYWSFYYDGSNSVHKYSTDGGLTWTSEGSVFSTSGVNETSIWYDDANNLVYAVGDTSSSSLVVYVQRGVVNPSSHGINWATSDSTVTVSSNNLAGKNTFICKDTSGYVWVLSSNCSQTTPQIKYKLTAFRSTSTDDITQWSYSGEMLPQQGITSADVRGSIVPAGTGINVWSVFAYGGAVYAKKYTGTWPAGTTIIDNGGGGATDNTETAPPSVVVDSRGVVHVVYGDSFKEAQVSKPRTMYSYNGTDQTTFVTPSDLDSYRPSGQCDKYPTISLDSSTGNLYVFWARTDSSGTPQTVMGRLKSSGSWTNLTFDTQNSYTKRFLTSTYKATNGLSICWQWTQNTTGTIHVIFDRVIPEFETLVPPVIFMIAVCLVLSSRRRTRRNRGIS